MAPKFKPDALTNCVICSQLEGDDAETVECEACRLWARLGCAGVTGKGEVFCPYCTQSRQVPKLRKNARKPESDAGTTAGAVKLPKDVRDQQELERSKQERKTADLIRNRREEMEKMFREKQLRIEKEMEERELAAANELRALKLKMEHEFQVKQRAAEQEFLSKQQEIKKLIDKSKQNTVFGGYTILEKQEKMLLAGEDEVDVIEIDEMEFESDTEEESRRKDAKMIGKEPAEDATGTVSLEVLKIVRIEQSLEHEKSLEGFEKEVLVTNVEKVTEDDEEDSEIPVSGKDKVSDGPGKPEVQGRLIQPDSVSDVIDDLRHMFGRSGKLLRRENARRFPDSYPMILSNDEDNLVKQRLGRKSTAAFESSPSPSPQRKQKNASSPGTAVYDGGGISLLASVHLSLKQLTTVHESLKLGVVEHSLMKAIAQSTGQSLTQIKTVAQTTGDLGLVAEQSKSSQRLIFRPTPHTVEGVILKLCEVSKMAATALMAKRMNKTQWMLMACRHSEARVIIRSSTGKLRIGLAKQSLLQALALACAMTWSDEGGHYKELVMKELGKCREAAVRAMVEVAVLVLLEFGPPCGEADRKPADGSEWCRDYGAADDKNARDGDRGPMRHENHEDCVLMWCGDRTQMHDGEPGGLGGMRRDDRDWSERGDGGGADQRDFGSSGNRRDDCDVCGVPRRDGGDRGADTWWQEDRHGRCGTGGRSSWEKRQALAARPLNAGDLVYIVDRTNRKSGIRGVVEVLIESGDGRIRQAWVQTCSGLVKRAAVRFAVLEIEGKPDPEAASEPGLRAGECCGYSLPRQGRHHAAASVDAWEQTPRRELTRVSREKKEENEKRHGQKGGTKINQNKNQNEHN